MSETAQERANWWVAHLYKFHAGTPDCNNAVTCRTESHWLDPEDLGFKKTQTSKDGTLSVWER